MLSALLWSDLNNNKHTLFDIDRWVLFFTLVTFGCYVLFGKYSCCASIFRRLFQLWDRHKHIYTNTSHYFLIPFLLFIQIAQLFTNLGSKWLFAIFKTQICLLQMWFENKEDIQIKYTGSNDTSQRFQTRVALLECIGIYALLARDYFEEHLLLDVKVLVCLFKHKGHITLWL